ncbi:MAG: phosphopantothenoylcysteine decarboxylase [Candidatus Omnitrophica bacterium]|nr:phosphopantothenoylcysteine decarboxylase [Candidatus Omnitrophota bacterium]
MPKRIKFLLVSGPTREPLDPVRYLTNHSTGVMGQRLFEALRRRGHAVDWVRCPEEAGTALELLGVLRRKIRGCDALIMAAAVCDARPARFSKDKIKKRALGVIRLVKNPDILAALAKKKKRSQFFVGFALESKGLLKHARDKMDAKRLDLVIAQPVTVKKTPFGGGNLEAYVIRRSGGHKHFASVSKKALAGFVVRETEKLLARWPSS